MIRKLPIFCLVLAMGTPLAYAHEGEVGIDLSKSTGDLDSDSRTFYADGHLPLKKNIQGELDVEFTNTNNENVPDTESSRIGFGIYSIQKQATFGVRINALSKETNTVAGKVDDNSTRIDFDTSVTLKNSNLINLGISRYSGDITEATFLHAGLDIFPIPQNMVSLEGRTSSDVKTIGARYLYMATNTIGISAKFIHDRFNDGVVKTKSNIFAVSMQYYFDEGGIKKKIDRLKARKVFWQSILR